VRGRYNNVDNRWICRHDLDDFLGYVDDLRNIGLLHHNIGYVDDHLRRRLEVACLLSLAPKILDGVHQLFWLINERLAEANGPYQVLVHFSDQFRELRDRLDVVVPGLFIHFWNIVGVLNESRGLNDFERIGGRRQNHGDERIRMERDGLSQFLEFGGAPFSGSRRRWRGIGCGGGSG
jgi:hypothetical protein